jgi:alkylation response protein AidB-like acyl-CoA dehydrogenase
VDFALTDEQTALVDRVRSYLAAHITPELSAEVGEAPEGGGPEWKAYIRQLGADGMLGVGWPTEYGGMGHGPVEQYLFFEEICRTGIPIPVVAVQTVAPAIMRVGTDAQKERYLPGILRGELDVAIAYSEPEAGSDLASLRTRAVRDGDEWVIDGQKVYTSGAHMADYLWLAARTDPDAPKHKGISVFIVDAKTPGITITPMTVMGGLRTNTTFYDQVRVPADALVGELNEGWSYITTQLNYERLALATASPVERTLEETIAWANEHTRDGRRVSSEPWVRDALAQIAVELDVLQLLNLQTASMLATGTVPYHEASMNKIFGTELHQRAFGTCLRVLGRHGGLVKGPGVHDGGLLSRWFMQDVLLTFGGGANEVHRNIVAMVGLGMPRG